MRRLVLIVVVSGICLVLGTLAGLAVSGNFGESLSSHFVSLFNNNATIYESKRYRESDKAEAFEAISWGALLPQKEKQLLDNKITGNGDKKKPLHEQIFQSIQRTFDEEYQQALISTNTVSELDNKTISINGFIVPVDVDLQRNITAFFIVPYFGACIHYPPPPPNQIIFVSLEEGGISGIEIQKPYSFFGKLTQGMYEDPQGTSAYLLDIARITDYNGETQQGTFHIESGIRNPSSSPF